MTDHSLVLAMVLTGFGWLAVTIAVARRLGVL